MAVNESWSQCYVNSYCELICKNAEGYFDLGQYKTLSPEECALAKADWEQYVSTYGDPSATANQQNGTDDTTQKGGSGLWAGGLFNFLGLGIAGSGKGNFLSVGNVSKFIIIAIIAAVILFFILKHKKK